jgi:hypothetical protein
MKSLILTFLILFFAASFLVIGCGCSGNKTQNDSKNAPATQNAANQVPLPYQSIVGNFDTNGELIGGWYWIRDSTLQQYAQWLVPSLTMNGNDLNLQITALATNKAGGGRGYDANFLLYYGVSAGKPNQVDINKLKMVHVKLQNVSPPSDPVGYTCEGNITLQGVQFDTGSTLIIRVVRESAGANHVALNKDSVRYYPSNGH